MKSDIKLLSEYHKRILSLLSPFMIFGMAIMFMGQYSFIKYINSPMILIASQCVVYFFMSFTLLCLYIEWDGLEIKNKLIKFISFFMTIIYFIAIVTITILSVINSINILSLGFEKGFIT